MIGDYTRRNLVPLPDTADARRLWMMVDPWMHRKKITQPTMIVNGTNDPYWTLDALNIYWDDLKGPKSVVYLPNAVHNLKEHREYAVGAVAALARHAITGRAFSGVGKRNAWSCGSSASTRAISASVNSTGDSWRRSISRE